MALCGTTHGLQRRPHCKSGFTSPALISLAVPRILARKPRGSVVLINTKCHTRHWEGQYSEIMSPPGCIYESCKRPGLSAAWRTNVRVMAAILPRGGLLSCAQPQTCKRSVNRPQIRATSVGDSTGKLLTCIALTKKVQHKEFTTW